MGVKQASHERRRLPGVWIASRGHAKRHRFVRGKRDLIPRLPLRKSGRYRVEVDRCDAEEIVEPKIAEQRLMWPIQPDAECSAAGAPHPAHLENVGEVRGERD